ncbi:hypothetical protein [Arcanobacterium canis]
MVERKGKLFRVGYQRRGESESSRHWLALNDPDAGEPMLTNEKLASLARERANEYIASRDGAQGK